MQLKGFGHTQEDDTSGAGLFPDPSSPDWDMGSRLHQQLIAVIDTKCLESQQEVLHVYYSILSVRDRVGLASFPDSLLPHVQGGGNLGTRLGWDQVLH